MTDCDIRRYTPACYRLAVALLLFGASWSAIAGQALERLSTFYRETRALEARFQQTVTGPDGGAQEQSRGRVWIQRPDRFRWDYREPFRQLIVADGNHVKFYDPEMAQVTVRPFDRGMGPTPSMVLSGSGDLERHFHVTDQGRKAGLAWVRLVPRKPGEAGFREAEVGLAGDPVRIRRFRFTDGFGNQTEVRFDNIRINPSLAPDRFELDTPPGTEVLGTGSNRN